ncbi:lysine transporter LysE [Pseudoalteromonas sp. NBT06-2]|uniref:LysE family translocator n=1 Tax=Pseudoalteromonas sp. NBT06-2 TaxID=2025950 RepID=UPI000BA6D883|nr:LysE family translocator [Pseudoalteromonas sp. NBT06-2]PAJ76257.1 lysine transporter LysE [Pseudoalteromonas sp. NBT06-2]
MSIEVWISFLLTSMMLCFTPGPTVFIVIGQSLNHGKKSVIPLITGVLCGDIIAMSISFVGLGALLATSAVLFSALKWIAAGYLVYLGLKAWFTKPHTKELDTAQKKSGEIFKEALIVTALNPKGIIFFIAFFPLFMNTNNAALPQMLIMGLSFLATSVLSASFYSFFSGYLRSKVNSIKFQIIFDKISGSMLIGSGAVTATLQKSS